MELKHTPSHWQFDTPDDSHVVSEDYHVIRAGCGFLAEARDEREPGFCIAGHMTVDDARLIAAAPDLLEALQSMEMALIGYIHQNDVTMQALAKCRAAMAKATGDVA